MAAKKDDKDAAGQVADTAAEQVSEAGRQGRRVADAAAEAGVAGLNQAADFSRRQGDQVRQLLGQGTRLYGDLGEVSRDDVDTLIETSARLAKGVQDMSWEMMNYTQQSLQLGLRTCNDLMTCRTVEDMLNVQRNFMRQSVDTFLQESAKLLEMSSGVANEAAAPIMRAEEMRQH